MQSEEKSTKYNNEASPFIDNYKEGGISLKFLKQIANMGNLRDSTRFGHHNASVI
jgi:hypothetical protein